MRTKLTRNLQTKPNAFCVAITDDNAKTMKSQKLGWCFRVGLYDIVSEDAETITLSPMPPKVKGVLYVVAKVDLV